MSRLLPVVVCLLAVLPGVAAATASATAAPPADCAGIQNTTAVVTDAAGERVTGTARLYPGSVVTLTVCSDGEPLEFGPVWDLRDSPVYERVGNTSESVRLRVVASGAGERVSLGDAVKRRTAAGPTVAVPAPNTATWNASDGTSVTLRFETAAERAAFESAAERRATAADRLDERLSALPQNGSAVGDTTTNASRVLAALREYERASAALERTAFSATATGDTEAVAAVVANSSEGVAAADRRVRERLTAYRTALSSRESSVVGTTRLAFGGALVGGLVVGGGVGVWFAGKRRAAVDFDQTYDSGTALDVRDVAIPLAAGALLLVGGLAGAVVLGVAGVIV